MRKMMAMALTALMLLALCSCGEKDFERNSLGYLTEAAAQEVAAQAVGYPVEDVYFSESTFEKRCEEYDAPHYHMEFSDSVAEYKYIVNAEDGSTQVDSES